MNDADSAASAAKIAAGRTRGRPAVAQERVLALLRAETRGDPQIPMRQHTIEQRLGMSAGSASSAIRGLESKGLVRTEPDKFDARAKFVRLTAGEVAGDVLRGYAPASVLPGDVASTSRVFGQLVKEAQALGYSIQVRDTADGGYVVTALRGPGEVVTYSAAGSIHKAAAEVAHELGIR